MIYRLKCTHILSLPKKGSANKTLKETVDETEYGSRLLYPDESQKTALQKSR